MLLRGAPAQRPAPAPDIRRPRQLLSASRVQVANFGRKFKHETVDNIPDLLPALILLGITAGCGPTTFPCSSIRSRCSVAPQARLTCGFAHFYLGFTGTPSTTMTRTGLRSSSRRQRSRTGKRRGEVRRGGAARSDSSSAPSAASRSDPGSAEHQERGVT
jgi:hypothetical protein